MIRQVVSRSASTIGQWCSALGKWHTFHIQCQMTPTQQMLIRETVSGSTNAVVSEHKIETPAKWSIFRRAQFKWNLNSRSFRVRWDTWKGRQGKNSLIRWRMTSPIRRPYLLAHRWKLWATSKCLLNKFLLISQYIWLRGKKVNDGAEASGEHLHWASERRRRRRRTQWPATMNGQLNGWPSWTCLWICPMKNKVRIRNGDSKWSLYWRLYTVHTTFSVPSTNALHNLWKLMWTFGRKWQRSGKKKNGNKTEDN